MLTDMYNSDFTEKVGSEPSLSVEDKLVWATFLAFLGDSIKLRDGKYEICLSLKHKEINPHGRRHRGGRGRGPVSRYPMFAGYSPPLSTRVF